MDRAADCLGPNLGVVLWSALGHAVPLDAPMADRKSHRYAEDERLKALMFLDVQPGSRL